MRSTDPRGAGWPRARPGPSEITGQWLAILTDSNYRVSGFGLPGFTCTEGPNTLPVQSGWTAMSSSRAGDRIWAYAVSTDDHVCFIDETQTRLRQ